jgi:hypothetical protein
MMTHRRGEGLAEPLTLSLTQRCGVFKARLGLLAKGGDASTELKELVFGLADQLDEDFALTPTATAKVAHHFGEVLLEAFNLCWQTNAAATAERCDASDEL